MAEKKIGLVVYRRLLSPLLEMFRVTPGDGTPFPPYTAGQFMALSRDNCRLTKKIPGPDGKPSFEYELDENGNPKRGQVTHSYSISSAPFETQEHGWLEYYVVLEMIRVETPGRLSESLFQIDPERDNRLTYVNKITGDFTLEKRAKGFRNVVMVGTGTGLAPFVSMAKELHHRAAAGSGDDTAYTLFHANRTFKELGYHEELEAIEREGKVNFAYVPSVSRPIPRDMDDLSLGKGRANNILRLVFEMSMKEEEEAAGFPPGSPEAAHALKVLSRSVRPSLPGRHTRESLRSRMDPASTVILTCGNPGLMEDTKRIADAAGIRFEKEEW